MSGRCVLYLGAVWPESRASAAGVRTLQVLNALRDGGWKTFCGSPARLRPIVEQQLKCQEGITWIDSRRCQPNDERFERMIQELNPGLVVFERFFVEEMFGARVKRLLPHAVRILDSQDIHSLRVARHKIVESFSEHYFNIDQVMNCRMQAHDETLQRELAAIHRCDATFVVSPTEKALLHQEMGVAEYKVHVAPFFYEKPDESLFCGLDQRNHAMTIGVFRHEPNVDALRWICASVWPIVRHRNPSARIDVFGAYPRQQDLDLTDGNAGVFVKGQVEDQYKTMSRYRVMLAPLRFGAGIKGKIADAWATGTPVVTTPIGAEGMGYHYESGDGRDVDLSWGGAVARTADKIAEAVHLLLVDDERWHVARSRGTSLLTKLFDKDKQSARLISFLDDTMLNCDDRRSQDYLGSVLWNESHRSTDFRSHYSELKAQLRSLQQTTSSADGTRAN